jgi:hypothetical protein
MAWTSTTTMNNQHAKGRCAMKLRHLILACAAGAGLCGCYATMARVTPQIQGRLVEQGRPVSGARVYIARDQDLGQCGETPGDAQSTVQGAFQLAETRQPEWVYPDPRYSEWTMCISYQGHSYVGYSMAKLDYPPAQLRLSCDLSAPQRQQTEHVAATYGLCRPL